MTESHINTEPVEQEVEPLQEGSPQEEESLGRPAPVLVLFLIIPLVGILIALAMVAAEVGQEDDPLAGADAADLAPASASLITGPAPNFQLIDMDGEPVSLADYEGRILFLNFWQTTCPPCVRELPAFAEFAADYADEDVSVLAINFEETSAMVADFFAEYDISGVHVALDPNSDVRRTYGVAQIPTTFVIGPDGTVRFMRLGEMEYEDMEDYVELVRTTDPRVE